MKHMIQRNEAFVCSKRVEGSHAWNHIFLTNCITTNHSVSIKEANYTTPFFIYPDEHKSDIFATTGREYNIVPELLDKLSNQWPQFQPEQLFYYVYAILYSNQYRQRFEQYLRMDFPRIPFTGDYELFGLLEGYGKELADIHLLKSTRLSPPLARYQGSGSNDTVEFIKYDEDGCTVQINPDKHFEGITPELWNYHIGGYQVLHKYLKDLKGKSLADPIHYCRMVTALALTIDLQTRVDQIIGNVIQ